MYAAVILGEPSLRTWISGLGETRGRESNCHITPYGVLVLMVMAYLAPKAVPPRNLAWPAALGCKPACRRHACGCMDAQADWRAKAVQGRVTLQGPRCRGTPGMYKIERGRRPARDGFQDKVDSGNYSAKGLAQGFNQIRQITASKVQSKTGER